MSERNGPGEIKTESRSPIITSGVAMPTHASNSIVTVMATAATKPASKPAESTLVLLIIGGHYALLRHLCQASRYSARRPPLQFRERNLQQPRDDASARDKRPAESARYLRLAAEATSMCGREFNSTQTHSDA